MIFDFVFFYIFHFYLTCVDPEPVGSHRGFCIDAGPEPWNYYICDSLEGGNNGTPVKRMQNFKLFFCDKNNKKTKKEKQAFVLKPHLYQRSPFALTWKNLWQSKLSFIIYLFKISVIIIIDVDCSIFKNCMMTYKVFDNQTC